MGAVHIDVLARPSWSQMSCSLLLCFLLPEVPQSLHLAQDVQLSHHARGLCRWEQYGPVQSTGSISHMRLEHHNTDTTS